jgi:hypothetical protein
MAKRKQAAAEPQVETRSFQEIIEDRMSKEPTMRDLIDDRRERNKKALANIEAQRPAQEKRQKRIAAATRGLRPGTSDYYRAAASVK